MSEAVLPRTRGQRGKDKTPRKIRSDTLMNGSTPENRKNVLLHNLKIAGLHKIDPNDPEQLSERVQLYFSICTQNEIPPAVASFALSLGIDRRTLWTWINGESGAVKNAVSIDIIKNAYSIINSQYEDLLNVGRINPVAAIFLMKNNYGYKDQTDHVITARAEAPETEEELTQRAALLGEGGVD